MLKADREVVVAVIAQDWQALGYAPAKLKADREVVLAAIAQNRQALLYAPAELKRTARSSWRPSRSIGRPSPIT